MVILKGPYSGGVKTDSKDQILKKNVVIFIFLAE